MSEDFESTESARIDEAFCRGRLDASQVLLIAFSGLGANPHRPYDFRRLLDRPDCSVLLVRDLANGWYQNVPGVEGGVDGLARCLSEYARNYSHVICLGFSMGGYAALLFGRLLGANAVLALAPQTLLTAEGLAGFGDPRWADLLFQARAGATAPHYLDLAKLYAKSDCVRPKVSICVPKHSDPLDNLHADHLASLGQILELGDSVVAHSGFGIWLRRSGVLDRLIDAAIGGRAPDLQGSEERYHAWLNSMAHDLVIDPPDTWVRTVEGLRVSGILTKRGPSFLALGDRASTRIRVGARRAPTQDKPIWPIEWRHEFTVDVLEPEQAYPFSFDVRSSDLPPGENTIITALVKEHDFWFSDLGFTVERTQIDF